MRVDVLCIDDVFDLGLAAVTDAFQTANELNEMVGLGAPRFDIRVVSPLADCRSVRTSQGLRLTIEHAPRADADCVVVPAIGFKMPAALLNALERPDVASAGAYLRQMASQETMIAGACIGTFLLAESGVLDHHEVTTTWWLASLFRERYPTVTLDESRMIVPSGNIVTAGAALSHMDLALWLIRGASPRLAELTAKYLIVDSRPSQSAYALSDHLIHGDPVVRRFEAWARSRLDRGFALDEAATVVGASKRTLARHIQRVLGKSPLSYFQRLRVERAVHLLRTSNATVDEIAAKVGYADGTTLRALLRKELQMGVRQIRGT